MNEIKKQFELVVPEMYKKQKRLIDGEEFDLDSVLEAIVDIKAGTSPDEKLYWRRNKAERSVAVSFLLDMSASTAEAIDEHKNQTNNDWGAPDDPVEYMAWLRSRRSEGLRKTYKRIVDVEKEGIVMMVNALETLGDTYGIYGFSGYGRENVEFYVIKDLEEKYSIKTPGSSPIIHEDYIFFGSTNGSFKSVNNSSASLYSTSFILFTLLTLSENSNNSINLIYSIDLGSRALISKINFLGNKVFKDRKLRSLITSEETKFWKFISGKKYLDESRMPPPE